LYYKYIIAGFFHFDEHTLFTLDAQIEERRRASHRRAEIVDEVVIVALVDAQLAGDALFLQARIQDL